jgi:glycosyltransferase involved in cell wall biosynthesis
MQGDNKVSIILPIYNCENFLEETLSDLLKQSYANWECILIDDGSTDSTAIIAKSFVHKDKRFKYLYQINQRQSAAKNYGLRNATGKFIQFLDDDDKIAHNKFKNAIEIFQANIDLDIIYSDARYYYEAKEQELRFSPELDNKPWIPQYRGNGHTLFEKIFYGNITTINSPILKREVINKVGYFSLDNHGFNEDWEFWMRCCRENLNFYFDSQEDSFAIVRLREGSTSTNKIRMHRSGVLVREKIFSWIKEIKGLSKSNSFYYNENYNLLKNTRRNLIKYEIEDKMYARAIFDFIKHKLKNKLYYKLRYKY